MTVAKALQQRFDCPVQVVPNRISPLKTLPSASEEQRATMLDIALGSLDQVSVNRVEFSLAQPSYTVQTLKRLRVNFSGPLVWAMGADAFNTVQAWHDWPELLNLAHVLVMTRPGNQVDVPALWQGIECEADELKDTDQGRWARLNVPAVEGSATLVRNARQNGQNWKHWVPTSVAHYIEENGLYE